MSQHSQSSTRQAGNNNQQQFKQFFSGKGVPPQVLAITAIISVQIGAATSKMIFPLIGPLGTVFLRLSFGAILLLLIWRPNFRAYTRQQYAQVVIFGISLAVMNGAFYAAIERIPIGIAVTLEFVGPLGVAIVQSRRLRDLVWALLAGAGILLLAPIGPSSLDPLGVGLALLAGVLWGVYIIMSARIGRSFTGGQGLSLSVLAAAILIAPAGIANGGLALLNPQTLLIGAVVGILSSVVPFSLEMEALRRLPSRVFGVLMSLEPAIAALVGLLLLKEMLDLRAILAIVFVAAASIGISWDHAKHGEQQTRGEKD